MMETNWFDLAKKICNPPMEKPQQYRILSPEEIIQEGDEWQAICNPLWGKVGTYVIGRTPKIFDRFEFRRPIPAKSATVECPGPDCQMCSGEYCAIHMGDPCDCDVIDRHKIAPISPVKESLSVEDESSDNSRSFREIERLKAERDELKALVLAIVNATCIHHSDSERKASGCPVCLKRERDEAREKIQTAELLWKQSQDGLIEAAQERDALRAENGKLKARNLINAVARICPDCGHSTSEDGCTFCLKTAMAPLFTMLHEKIGDKDTGYWGSIKIESELISTFEIAQSALAGTKE